MASDVSRWGEKMALALSLHRTTGWIQAESKNLGIPRTGLPPLRRMLPDDHGRYREKVAMPD